MNLHEAQFEVKRKKKGEIKFPTSSFKDPFIIKAIKAIAQHAPDSNEIDVSKYIAAKVAERQEATKKAPLLYNTMTMNAIEQEVFSLFWKINVPVAGAPKFSNVVFNKLIRMLKVEYDEFFPLRSHIDKRHLTTPVIEVIETPPEPEAADTAMTADEQASGETKREDLGGAPTVSSGQVPTAAASPDGTFYFNEQFMQALMNYSYLKGVKPKGEKYKSNGGKFPDEYCWIEFLILHEFMHYTNDDFYYQKVIPGADPQIINWVGDFRTNYLLTKSGFEPLPMGLFNDEINYDRQTEYIEMYRLVEEEFKKLAPENQDQIKEMMDKMSDDHQPGNEAGEKSDVDGGDLSEEDIDEMGKASEEAVDEEREKKEPGEGEGEGEGGGEGEGESDKGGRAGGKNPKRKGVDYDKVNPRFNWKTLMDKFIKTGMARTEETYNKPARRGITTSDIARQVGAAAIKPAQRPLDMSDAKLMFIIDNSGSMNSAVKTVVANAKKLLATPMFKKATILTLKFSNDAELYKVNVGRNIAGQIPEPNTNPKKWDQTADYVLGSSFGGGTTISAKMVQQTAAAINMGYNVILFSDRDINYGQNLKAVVQMIKNGRGQMYVILDSRKSYISFRKASGMDPANITYFG